MKRSEWILVAAILLGCVATGCIVHIHILENVGRDVATTQPAKDGAQR